MSQKRVSRELKRGLGGWAIAFVLTVLSSALYVHSSAPAAAALEFAQHDAAVQNAVGGVEDARLGWIGNIHFDGNDGWASFKMHLVGGHTNGTMDITLQRQFGKWNVSSCTLVTDSGNIVRIDGPATKIE